MQAPGWYHAQGDPAHTVRYWDGSGWLGAPVAPHERETAGGFDLIAPLDHTTPDHAHVQTVARPRGQVPVVVPAGTRRSDRLATSGFIMIVLGVVLGIAGHNMATLFSTPTEVQGIVSEVREQPHRRGAILRIEISSEAGEFYTGGRVRTFSPSQRAELGAGPGMPVKLEYSELTGGLVAIDEFGDDRRPVGRFLWPFIALVSMAFALAKIWYDLTLYRDRVVTIGLLLLYFVVGPMLGIAAVDPLDTILNELYHTP